MLENVKSPSFVVTAVWLVPRVSLRSVTSAPGIVPPCASLTVPVMVADVTWAEAGSTMAPSAMAIKPTAAIFCVDVMSPPLGSLNSRYEESRTYNSTSHGGQVFVGANHLVRSVNPRSLLLRVRWTGVDAPWHSDG